MAGRLAAWHRSGPPQLDTHGVGMIRQWHWAEREGAPIRAWRCMLRRVSSVLGATWEVGWCQVGIARGNPGLYLRTHAHAMVRILPIAISIAGVGG